MKIAVPVNDDRQSVCASFGRAPYFALWSEEQQVWEYVDNSAIASEGGAGIKAAQVLADQHVQVLLTPRLGENAAAVLRAADIALYATQGQSLQANLQAYRSGELTALADIHPGFHGQGGN